MTSLFTALLHIAALLTGTVVASAAHAQTAATNDIVKRGEYLARAGDCIACHTAPDGRTFSTGLSAVYAVRGSVRSVRRLVRSTPTVEE